MKQLSKRVLSFMMVLLLIIGLIPVNVIRVNAADTTTVSLNSLGQKGTVKIGSKTKSGTWWQMILNDKKAFCVDLGYTCHNGNTYEKVETKKWDQSTGGKKDGYYAKIIRWYVLDKKKSTKGYVMAQALIWSVANERTSEKELKDVIEQVQKNIGISKGKKVADLYKDIFEPSGDWTAQVTYWKKTGNSKSYQKLMTVDADSDSTPSEPKSLSSMLAYRQRVTLHKEDEDGNARSGIQFTLTAHNIDQLYSFAMTDINGYTGGTADEDDTDFTLTGLTNNNGNIAFRMTYRIYTMKYYYYTDDELKDLSADQKKALKKKLTDDLELDEGVDFPSDLTKASAQAMLNKELEEDWAAISNDYTLTEDNTGSHTDIIIDPTYANGYNFTLNKDSSWVRDADNNWPDMALEDSSSYDLAYKLGITNKKKRANVKVVKVDKYSDDKKPHGEAALDGAEFTLFADEACTTQATVSDASGNEKTAGTYTVKDGVFSTDYLKTGVTYYLKEMKSPDGYTLSNDVIPITINSNSVTAEYTSDAQTVEYGNAPILGKVAIQKYYSDGETGQLEPEAETTFQVYLSSKGSYDKCDDYERATITTDSNGYAITSDLYVGKYTVHQADSGNIDAIKVKDFEVEVTEAGKTYSYTLNNKLFKAFLRIVKKDGNTEKQVLKSGTTYQIYKVNGDEEELVEQSYANGNKMEKISKFVTDETGEILTVKALVSGTYRIYEIDSASGLHKTEKYIEVTINSKADNYEGYIDEDGNSHAIITLTYTNKETYGKLKIYKQGQMLTGVKDNKFVYENRYLKGAVFEVYAAEDIMTQDNQGTKWYDKDALVATITTGEDAQFTKECKDITGKNIDENGVISITVPLGKYHIKEVKTPYGYIISDKEWDVDFAWENYEDEYVINATKESDENGVINAVNELAKTQVSLLKKDANNEKPIQGAVFGLYTKNDIYNVFGEKIVDAGTQLVTLITGGSGTVVCNLQLPIMGENYGKVGSEAALNSGDYYLKEISISDSYYTRDTEYPIHLEYKDQNTKVVAANVEAVNTHTDLTVSKMDITGSAEVKDCDLEIKDKDGNVIIKWTSGVQGTIVLNERLGELGYRNVSAYLDEKGNLQVSGLFHDETYTLTETRPADGYVTSGDIAFVLTKGVEEQTVVSVYEGEELKQKENHTVLMCDDTTKIRLLKLASDTGEGLAFAKFEVYDSDKNKVLEFETTDEGYDITGILTIGKTYTFKEVEAPKGYKIAKPVEYTINDTGEIQQIVIKDKRKPKVPQTGGITPFVISAVITIIIFIIGMIYIFRKREKK